MRRRNTYTRRRRSYNEPRRRSVMMRPGVQITIVIVAALIIYILLQSAGR